MGQKRRAEARDVRQWDGDVAAANDLSEVRTWVVWGVGADPSDPERAAVDDDEEPRGRPGNDIARTIAVDNDAEWADAADWDRWVILVDADEDDVDGWAEDDDRVRGYAPYLLQPAEPDLEPMEGTLRNDNVVRRTGSERFDAGRPH
jgi:hypothetical protein